MLSEPDLCWLLMEVLSEQSLRRHEEGVSWARRQLQTRSGPTRKLQAQHFLGSKADTLLTPKSHRYDLALCLLKEIFALLKQENT